jgi:hypothetical protein
MISIVLAAAAGIATQFIANEWLHRRLRRQEKLAATAWAQAARMQARAHEDVAFADARVRQLGPLNKLEAQYQQLVERTDVQRAQHADLRRIAAAASRYVVAAEKSARTASAWKQDATSGPTTLPLDEYRALKRALGNQVWLADEPSTKGTASSAVAQPEDEAS